MRSIGGLSNDALLVGCERGRPVRIEREARTFSLQSGSLTERAAHAVRTGTSALPAQTNLLT